MNPKKKLILRLTLVGSFLGLITISLLNIRSFKADTQTANQNTNGVVLQSASGQSLAINNYNNWHFQFKPTDQSFDSKMATASKYQELNYTESWDQSGVTVAKLKALNPDVKVYRTYTLNVKPTWDSDWNNPSDLNRLQFPITRAMINDPNNVRGGAFDQNATDDWWMRDGNGNVIKESDTQWFVDIGDPRFKEIFLQTILDRNAGKGFDGILFDYWWPGMISSWITGKGQPAPAEYPDNNTWFNNAWKPFITYVMTGLHSAGYTIIGNCAGEYNSGNTYYEFQRSMIDGTVYEQGSIDWPDQGGKWLPGSTIEKRLTSIATDPLNTWIGTYGLRFTDPLFAQKNIEDLAFFYIGLPQDSNLRAKRSYHYYGDGGLFWDKLWDFNIGDPAADKTKITGKYAWSRKYTDGMVLLNYGDTAASTESINFALDKTYQDQSGTQYSGTVTLPAHTGLMLKTVLTNTASTNANSTSANTVSSSQNNNAASGSRTNTVVNSSSQSTPFGSVSADELNPSSEIKTDSAVAKVSGVFKSITRPNVKKMVSNLKSDKKKLIYPILGLVIITGGIAGGVILYRRKKLKISPPNEEIIRNFE